MTKKLTCSVTDIEPDFDPPFKPIEITIADDYIEFNFPGYGVQPLQPGPAEMGQGGPVYIEYRSGVPHLVVWGDINNEEPTHSISLAGAHESLRKEA